MATSREVEVSPPEESANWPELFSRLVDELSTIIGAEIKISSASLERALSSSLDRSVARAGFAMVALYGLACVIVGIVLLLHQWMGWWLATVIPGLAILILAALGYVIVARAVE